MANPLWRTKPVSSPSSSSGLKRVLSAKQLIIMGVGIIIGAGLFSLTGVAAGQNAGPAITLSFIVAAIACGFAGLCYGELAGMIPSSGSAYSYAYASMGEFIAWIIGWDLVLEYTVAASAVASSWSGYVSSMLAGWGIVLDPRFLAPTMSVVKLADGSQAYAWVNAPAIVIISLVSALLMCGTKESTKINNFIVFIKLTVIALVYIFCIPHIKMSNFHPFIPTNTGIYGQFGLSGIMRAAGMAFFAYIGFDIISTTAQDSRNPARDLPIGIIGSLIICAIVYATFSLVLTGVVNYKELANDPSPVATAINTTGYVWLNTIIKLGICLGYTSVLFGLLLGQARVFLTMSNDGLLPKVFARLNKKTHTPWTSHIIFGVISSVLAATVPIGVLGNMTSIGTLLAFIIVCIGVPVLRWRHPNVPRRFKVPGGIIIPALGVVSCSAVIFSLDSLTWLRLIVWLVIGCIVYFFYGIRHSHLSR
ncbi:APC family permease [Swingsia samuiensis]|uniref:Amino acid permease n=1 Tax=Swingsia samuiensis TaxID=1293412 RepID=A0A4Y6UM44_9PROT|nr:amino acid permease [Swingsia samuiensis]QDH17850.1 amino acid permease [Swingsia samuiensis]